MRRLVPQVCRVAKVAVQTDSKRNGRVLVVLLRKMFLIVITAFVLSGTTARADSLSLGVYAPEAQIPGVTTSYKINTTLNEGVLRVTSNQLGLTYFANDLLSGTDYDFGRIDLVVYFKKFDGVNYSVDLSDTRNSLAVLFDDWYPNQPIFQSGKLYAFGWNSSADPEFQFVWRKDHGASEVIASPLPFIGAIVKPTKGTSSPAFNNTFNADFQYAGGQADVFLTPVPSAACGGGLCMSLFAISVCCRRRLVDSAKPSAI